MSSNVRTADLLASANRYTILTIDEYDVDEWDPLDGFEDSIPYERHLDLEVIKSMGESVAYIAKYYDLTDAPFHSGRTEGEEVGDDRIDFSCDHWNLSSALMCQERVSRMVTSANDTTISSSLWNFCEVTNTIPRHPGQSFDRCRKVGEFKDLGFVDVPPLRILLDVMKGDRSHSSTAVGKATMLGSRMRTPRSEFLRDMHLASYLQDGYLRTSKSSEPKYLPQIMGGSGVRALFSNPVNLHLYVKAYRGGRCDRIYGSATRELRQSVDSLELGKRVIMPILNRRLRDRQEYLHGTYAEKIFIPKRSYMLSFRENLPDPLIEESGGANLFASFENRLLRTRHLVTRTGAEREWENTTRIRDRLLSRYSTTVSKLQRESFEKKAARRKFGMALNANTALANLLERKGSLSDVIQLTNDNFIIVHCGATHFTKWDAEWLFFGGKGESFSIEDLTSSEDLYLRTEVSEEETMKVGSIPLRPIVGNVQRRVVTTTSVGLYEIGSGMYEWACNLTDRLIEHRREVGRPLRPADALRDYAKDPEWVNDDTLIIARCLHDTVGRAARSTTVALVSADRRLANQLSNSCNVTVVWVDPRSYISTCLELGFGPLTEVEPEIVTSFLGTTGQHPLSRVYVDTGSVNSFLARIESREGGKLKFHINHSCSGGDHWSRPRTSHYSVVTTDIMANLQYRIIRPIERPKRFRTASHMGSEVSSRRSTLTTRSLSAKSWREGI